MLRTLTLLMLISSSRLLATSFSYSTVPTPGFGDPFAQAPASGINDQGTVVGSYLIGLHFAMGGGFLYKDGSLSTLDLPPYAVTPTGINNSDQIVGYYDVGRRTLSTFLYQNGTYTYFNYPGVAPDTTTFVAIANNGTILGRYPSGLQSGFFLLNNGSYAPLPTPPDAGYTALNDSGELVGAYSPNEYTSQAALFRNGHMQLLQVPIDAANIYASAINDEGDIVGSGDTGESATGFFLRDGKYSILSFPGASYTVPTGINNKDQIAGWYVLASSGSFEIRSFVATPVPEPSTLVLLGTMLALGSAVLWRKLPAPVPE